MNTLSIGNFIEIIEMYVLSAYNNWATAHLTWKQLTLRNHLNLFKVITSIHGYLEVPSDNAQRQFVYFIVAICRNTLKNFLSQIP